MGLLLIFAAILLFILALKLIKNLVKTIIAFFLFIIILSALLGYLMYQDYNELKAQKIIFLEKDEQTLEMADRYVTFNTDKTNLTSTEIVKEYWQGNIDIYPQTILFRVINYIK